MDSKLTLTHIALLIVRNTATISMSITITHDHIYDEQGRVIPLGTHLLAKNDQLAAENRTWFAEQRICVLSLVSSPSSCKTALLEKIHLIRRENYRSQ